jgi:hypothetical protein
MGYRFRFILAQLMAFFCQPGLRSVVLDYLTPYDIVQLQCVSPDVQESLTVGSELGSSIRLLWLEWSKHTGKDFWKYGRRIVPSLDSICTVHYHTSRTGKRAAFRAHKHIPDYWSFLRFCDSIQRCTDRSTERKDQLSDVMHNQPSEVMHNALHRSYYIAFLNHATYQFPSNEYTYCASCGVQHPWADCRRG